METNSARSQYKVGVEEIVDMESKAMSESLTRLYMVKHPNISVMANDLGLKVTYSCNFVKDLQEELYHFLFVCAPNWHTKLIQPVHCANGRVVFLNTELTLEEDREKRRQEIDNFCRSTFPQKYFDTKKSEKIQKLAEVSTADDIEKSITDFFLGRSEGPKASGAVHAVVVFIGHGSPNGFCVRDDITSVNLNEIIAHVWECWSALKADPGSATKGLPMMVEIIFSQCYSHVYDQSLTCENLNIVHVTDEGKVESKSMKKEDGTFYIVELCPIAEAICEKIVEETTQR